MHGETGTDGGRGPDESPRVPPNVPYAQPGEQTPHVYDTEPGQAAQPDAGQAPSASPNVYLPQADPAPAYDEYADPAAAHGWTSAYDETRELPAQAGPSEPTGAAEPTGLTMANTPTEPVGRPRTGEGRATRRRAERRTGSRRRVVAVALGVAGAVAVIAAVAGGSGSPASDGPGPDSGTHAVVGDSATASPRTDAGSSAASTAAPASSSASPSRSSASSSTGAAQEKASAGPTATTSARAGAPTSTATTADPPTSTSASPDGRGHGHGATKRPR